MIYKDKIFTLFPERDKINDINVVGGKGFLERYNETVGQSLDEEITDKIDNLVDSILAIDTCQTNSLAYLELDRGVTLNYVDAPEEFRRAVLKNVLNWYKIKGTEKLLRILLSMIGIEVILTEVFPNTGFDSETTFDDEYRTFDLGCNSCVGYTLYLMGDHLEITPSLFRALLNILAFNMPLDVRLLACSYNGDVAVDYTVTISRSRSGDVSYSNPYDPSLFITYDGNTPIITTDLPYYTVTSPTELQFTFLGDAIIS